MEVTNILAVLEFTGNRHIWIVEALPDGRATAPLRGTSGQ
jgi:hypothetical protein